MVRMLPLLLSIALLTLGQGLINLLFVVHMEHADRGVVTIGWFMACFYVGQLAAALVTPWLLHKAGHIRAYAALVSLVGATMIAHALFDITAWPLLRTLDGLCFFSALLIAERWLGYGILTEDRAPALIAYVTVTSVALGASQFLVGLASPSTPTLFLVAALLVAVALTPLTASRIEEPPPPNPAFYSLNDLAGQAPLAIATLCASGLILGSFVALAPSYLLDAGFSVPAVGQAMGAAILGGLVLHWPLGMVSNSFDRRTVTLVVAALLVPVSLVLLFVTSRGVGPTVVGLVAFGGLATTLYPLAIAHIADRVPAAQRGDAAATGLMVQALSAVIGPVLVSLLMAALWPGALFASSAMIGAWLAGLIGWRISASPSDETQGIFTPLPPTTPSVARLGLPPR